MVHTGAPAVKKPGGLPIFIEPNAISWGGGVGSIKPLENR